MDNRSRTNRGTRLLIKRFRNEFNCPENINHYSEEDFKEAERKYVKYRLEGHPKT